MSNVKFDHWMQKDKVKESNTTVRSIRPVSLKSNLMADVLLQYDILFFFIIVTHLFSANSAVLLVFCVDYVLNYRKGIENIK